MPLPRVLSGSIRLLHNHGDTHELVNGVPAAGRGHCSSYCSTGGGGWGLGPDQGREVAHSGLLGPLLCLMSGGIEWWDSGGGGSFIRELARKGCFHGGDKFTLSEFWLCARCHCHAIISSQPNEVQPAIPFHRRGPRLREQKPRIHGRGEMGEWIPKPRQWGPEPSPAHWALPP